MSVETTAPRAVELDGATILERARAAGPALQEEAAGGERRRRLTDRAVAVLRGTGVFRMAMPRAWGGPEVDPCTQLEIVEALARADGSAGWCAMIGSDGGFYTAALDDATGRALYPQLDAVTAGWVQPGGTLEVASGGYRLSGRWRFGSGCTHADVVVGGAVVVDHGSPVTTPEGHPEVRIALLPADRVEVVETWDPMGLAGTGSHDYAVDGELVPRERTFRLGDRRRAGALYAWPGLFFLNLPGVPLGIARAALDEAEELLAGKVLVPEMRPARDDPHVRVAVARAEAMVGAARSYVFDSVGGLWEVLRRGGEPSRRRRAAAAGCVTHAVTTCRDAVSLVADAVGTAAVRRPSRLERAQRDLTTMCQHVVAQQRFLGVVGGLWIDGADTDHPLVRQRIV